MSWPASQFPHPCSDFPVFFGNVPAPSRCPARIPHILAMGEKSAQSCPVPVLSLGWARSFSLELHKWGESGLAPPLGLLRSSDTLLGKTRESRKAARNGSVAPPLRRGDLVRASYGRLGMLETGSRDAFCVNRQPSRLCRASGCKERSWDITGGESAVFIHCSLSRAQGVPLVFILC